MQIESQAGRVFLDRYEAMRFIGHGSMGQVWLCRRTGTNRFVVAKLMHDHIACQPKFREMFQREMGFMARFKHPHAVEFIESAVDPTVGPIIIMEYIPGVTLDAIISRHKRLPAERVCRLTEQLCKALHAAHLTGIVHRDLKPANLMVIGPDEPDEVLKVMDLGLALLTWKPFLPIDKLSGHGEDYAVGTPAYIAPEQLRGDEMDHRGDLYSIGVILYELLAGRLPFDHEMTDEVLEAHRSSPPPAFVKIGVTDVPPAVEKLVMMLLAKYPNERPQTAFDVAFMFRQALGGDEPDEADFEPSEMVPEMGDESSGNFSAALQSGSNQIVVTLEAWMPERIAVVKLRGFIEDLGGRVVESIPGLVRVRLFEPKPPPQPPKGWLGWLLHKPPPERPPDAPPPLPPLAMDLFMVKKDSGYKTSLELTVVCTTPDGPLPSVPKWHKRCRKVLNELKSYLMAQDNG